MRKIEVVPYDPSWKDEFEKAKKYFQKILSNCNIKIEHVGSTSVIGLHAKPILDIDIVVENLEESEDVIKILSNFGYEHLGNMGIEGREAFRNNKTNPEVTWIKHNLYVCLKECESLTNHLLLRKHLRNNKKAVQEYGALKIKLAEKFPDDIDSYVEGKSKLISSFLALEGFGKKALSRIKMANKKK